MPLKKNEVENFKKRLLKMREQLTHSLKESSEEAKFIEEGHGHSQHQADQGTDDFDKTVSLELSNQEFHILRQIDRALEKIEQQTYGICDITEEEISKARLEAVPYATMTVQAQEKLEKGLL